MTWTTLDPRAAGVLGQGKGASVRALPPLKGKGIDAIRTTLGNAGSRYYPAITGQEIWMNPTDNSLVRISPVGGTTVRRYYHFKKEITAAPAVYDANSVVAKLTDSGVVVPDKIGSGCGPDLTAWFQSKLGRAPTAGANGTVNEVAALGNAWGIATHIPVNP